MGQGQTSWIQRVPAICDGARLKMGRTLRPGFGKLAETDSASYYFFPRMVMSHSTNDL